MTLGNPIQGVILFDTALAFIQKDALDTVINHNERNIKNHLGGCSVNAYEILAYEFEEYWRCRIASEHHQ